MRAPFQGGMTPAELCQSSLTVDMLPDTMCIGQKWATSSITILFCSDIAGVTPSE